MIDKTCWNKPLHIVTSSLQQAMACCLFDAKPSLTNAGLFPIGDLEQTLRKFQLTKPIFFTKYIWKSRNGDADLNMLARWGRDKMAAISHTIFSNAFLKKCVSLKISLKFVPGARINIIPVVGQMMACRRPGDEPLSEPMMVNLLTRICVARPQ